MSNNTPINHAECFGRWLGPGWRGYIRRERRVAAWLVAQGVPAVGADALLWIIKLGGLALLLYAATWVTLLVMLAVAVVWITGNASQHESTAWAIGDQADHKKSVFYDPKNYNDDPDPRFDDER